MYTHRNDFPAFSDPSWVYLDNAATTQKPQYVLDALMQAYTVSAPIGRSAYARAEVLTAAVEAVRMQVADYLGAESEREIVFAANATTAFAMTAYGWLEQHLKPGDEIVVSQVEHHASLLHWITLAQKTGASLSWLRIDADGFFNQHDLATAITKKTKFLALSITSNVLGSLEKLAPSYNGALITTLIEKAHAVGATVLLDACQAAPHEMKLLHRYPADLMIFSAHKMLGPYGVAILYCKRSLHQEFKPLILGGGMASDITAEYFVPRAMPHCLEAGTLPAPEIIAFGAALSYMNSFMQSDFVRYQHELIMHFRNRLERMPKVAFLGPSREYLHNEHLISFTIQGLHAHDVAAYLDVHNVCVRAGNHCARFVHDALGISASVRVSVYGYTRMQEMDRCADLIEKCIQEYTR